MYNGKYGNCTYRKEIRKAYQLTHRAFNYFKTFQIGDVLIAKRLPEDKRHGILVFAGRVIFNSGSVIVLQNALKRHVIKCVDLIDGTVKLSKHKA